jgi:hypothetical protein
MLLLNQRSWDHHATALVLTAAAIWQAIGFGNVSRRARIGSLVLVMAAGPMLWLTRGDMLKGIGRLIGHDKHAAEDFANRVEAFGPVFVYFLLLLAASAVLALALRRRDPAYLAERQRVLDRK